MQPADNAQRIKAGLEWAWLQRFALRTGYNFNADALRFSAGLGLSAQIGQTQGAIDYAYTDGGPLGGVNRLSLGIKF